MRILVYGAGVIGSVYAAHLHRGGHEVSVLARGRRLAEIREHGVVAEAVFSGRRIEAPVAAVETLAPDDAYDLVLVTMQKGHLDAVLPLLAANRCTPSVAFLGNNAAGPDPLTDALGADRVLMGFPMLGGFLDGPVVRYSSDGRDVKALRVVLGEPGGATTQRLRAIVEAFSQADIVVDVEPHIDAWLKGHVALVVPMLFALDRYDLDTDALARDRATLRLVVRAIREGLAVLQALGLPITPLRLRTISWLPVSVTAWIFSKIVASEYARVAFVGHARHATAEFDLLLGELRALASRSGLATPALDELCVRGPASPSTSTPSGRSGDARSR